MYFCDQFLNSQPFKNTGEREKEQRGKHSQPIGIIASSSYILVCQGMAAVASKCANKAAHHHNRLSPNLTSNNFTSTASQSGAFLVFSLLPLSVLSSFLLSSKYFLLTYLTLFPTTFTGIAFHDPFRRLASPFWYLLQSLLKTP